MRQKKPVVAICYDFDGTLAPGNMQEYGFFPGLTDDNRRNFWNYSAALAKQNGANQILAYMQLMLEKAKESKNQTDTPLKTTRKAIQEYGKSIKLFPGVDTWFKRIREHGKTRNLQVEHYIVSSGLKEMIEGSPIAKEFAKIYACSFMYDHNDAAMWPAQVVDCTSKTQYLFRISKAAHDLSETKELNARIDEKDRHVPFHRMIYIGDGSTDVPSMMVVRSRGGYSIAVYQPKSRSKRKEALGLLNDERVHFCFPADYREGKPLETTVKAILDKAKADWDVELLMSKAKASLSDPKSLDCEKDERSTPMERTTEPDESDSNESSSAEEQE